MAAAALPATAQELQQRLVTKSGAPLNTLLDLEASGNELVYSGLLTMTPKLKGARGIGSFRRSVLQAHVFLCTKVLLVTQASDDLQRFVLLSDPLDLDQCTVCHVFYNDDCEFQVEECSALRSPVKPANPMTSRGSGSPTKVFNNVYGFRATDCDEKTDWVLHIHEMICRAKNKPFDEQGTGIAQHDLVRFRRKTSFIRRNKQAKPSSPVLEPHPRTHTVSELLKMLESAQNNENEGAGEPQEPLRPPARNQFHRPAPSSQDSLGVPAELRRARSATAVLNVPGSSSVAPEAEKSAQQPASASEPSEERAPVLRRFAGRLGRAFGGGNKEQRPKSIAAPDIEIGKSKRLIETWEQFQKQQVSGAAGSGSTGKLKIIDRDTYEANKAYFERVAQLPPSALPSPRRRSSFDIPKTKQNVASLVRQIVTEDEERLKEIASETLDSPRLPSSVAQSSVMMWDYSDDFGLTVLPEEMAIAKSRGLFRGSSRRRSLKDDDVVYSAPPKLASQPSVDKELIVSDTTIAITDPSDHEGRTWSEALATSFKNSGRALRRIFSSSKKERKASVPMAHVAMDEDVPVPGHASLRSVRRSANRASGTALQNSSLSPRGSLKKRGSKKKKKDGKRKKRGSLGSDAGLDSLASEIAQVLNQGQHLLVRDATAPATALSPRSPDSSTADLELEARARRRTELLASLPRDLMETRHLGSTLGTFLDRNWQTLMFPEEIEAHDDNNSRAKQSLLTNVAASDQPLLTVLRQHQLKWREDQSATDEKLPHRQKWTGNLNVDVYGVNLQCGGPPPELQRRPTLFWGLQSTDNPHGMSLVDMNRRSSVLLFDGSRTSAENSLPAANTSEQATTLGRLSADSMSKSQSPIYEDPDAVGIRPAAGGSGKGSQGQPQSSSATAVQTTVSPALRTASDVISAIPPEVHAMYLGDGWEPVPTDSVPTSLRWAMPQQSALGVLGAFHMRLIAAYHEMLPHVGYTAGL